MDLVHGGDIVGYREKYGRDPVDFSANCNPLGMPEAVARAAMEAVSAADRYPDPLCRKLRKAISRAEGVPMEQILCGNGAADLIFRLALARRPRRALLTAPAFAEYEQALSTVDCKVQIHQLREEDDFRLTDKILEQITPDIDLLFLCTPNNPTGWPVEPALLKVILERCRETGTMLALDECFCCLLDDPEAWTMTGYLEQYPNLLIFKAFTKLYAMAGLRLGYCLCADESLLERMAACAQPWAVSHVAQEAGIAALAQEGYRIRTRKLIREEREYLRRELTLLGIRVIGSQANYLFIRTDLPDLGQRLKERGILLRSCANYRGLDERYYRLAVRTPEENRLLIRELRDMILFGEGKPTIRVMLNLEEIYRRMQPARRFEMFLQANKDKVFTAVEFMRIPTTGAAFYQLKEDTSEPPWILEEGCLKKLDEE